jgi:DNA-binding NtrC family response regulator
MNPTTFAPPPRILIVDDDSELRLSLRDWFSGQEVELFEAGTCTEARALLHKHSIDLVLLDIHLPDGNGIEMLPAITEEEESPEVVMITSHASVENAVEAMKQGAWDFVRKDFWNQKDLGHKIARALEHHRIKREASVWRASHALDVTVVGKSAKLQSCLATCHQLANTDHRVLILGETGTGKEVLARYLHAQSRRARGPFMAISCTNLPESLAESELFGHERGAFTGATTAKPGKVDLANGGTLFLDEIGDAPLSIQAKLLRFLQTNQYQRIGGIKDRTADVRIIAATNHNLAEDVKNKTFREDLFYRLNVIQIVLPPLRDRKEDIPELVRYFLMHFSALAKPTSSFLISQEATNLLMKHGWPGNIRELRNVIERATAFCKDGTILPKDLQLDPHSSGRETECHCHERSSPIDRALLECEKKIIVAALRETGWNQTKAAGILGRNRINLNRRMSALGIPPRQGNP